MQFRSLAAAALIGAASAVDVQVVTVGMNPMTKETKLSYFPEKITAEPGTMVQFQFMAGNHTVTQSNFDSPCMPISMVDPTKPGIFSGAMDVAAGASTGTLPVWTIMVQDKNPMWLYCTTGPHCKSGMAVVINENTAANNTRSLEKYKEVASSFQGVSPVPGSTVGGERTSVPSSSTPSTNNSSSSNGTSSDISSPSTPSSSSRPGSGSGTDSGAGNSNNGPSPTSSPSSVPLSTASGLVAQSGILLIALTGAIALL